MKQLSYLLYIFVGIQTSFAQLGFSHEVGIIAGPVTFQSDFGARNDFENTTGNTGYGIGIVHYINFSYRADCNCYTTDTYFNDHFKLRSEISWNKTKLNHFGQWVDEPRNSPNADRLRAHSGEANNLDIGMQMEYYPFSIRSFQNFGYSFAPFVSFGAHFTAYNPKVFTTYGDLDPANASNFFSSWQPGSVDPSSGSTFTLVGSVGVRYKLDIVSDIMLDLRWQYFGSDWVDGLNHQLSSNQTNDWLAWLNIGYIYYLD